MNFVWGSLMAFVGLFFFISALTQSKTFIYALFVARSKVLWGKHVHLFYLIVGIILIGLSSLFFLGLWG